MKTVKPALFGTKKPRAKPVDREGLEQASLMREVALRYPAAAKLIYHVPNGGHRVKAVAAKLKAQGVKAGVPDLVLPMARGGHFGLYIEFKAKPPFDAAVSPSQDAYIQALLDQGYLAIVCRGSIDAMEAIRAYLLQPQTRAAA
ncbi:VRR-NUC domain-containing protein [Pseudomonas fontis]|uniref:VRR-NUC domain-containing protein n=1 Tax=Pseudomonas fontis TaxID=2942633 RepID=A0ABT5NLI8_9PSED|nr:VRR-NUC domain-containing protein [Pseudomonas fontis]MDD0974957.1 VRR-NUC domain-containing protein [Pseudomonas fontis]MDD0989398.1 VRR-NUC domain-containing protein [Pseudomonas fontis]